MRNILNFTGIFFFAISMFFYPTLGAKAQTSEKSDNKIYFQMAIGATTYKGKNFELGLQTVIKNKWSATASYQHLSMDPSNLPADYQPESGIVFLIPYTNKITVNMNCFNLSAGKYFQMGRNSWFTAEAGLSVVSGQRASFKPASPVSSDPILIFFLTSTTSSNYTTSIENKTSLGGIVRADANWALTSFLGLGAGVFANINSIQSPIGLNIKLTLGDMGKSPKKKNR